MKNSEKPENSNGKENSADSNSSTTNKPCTSHVPTCANIEPIWPLPDLSLDYPWVIAISFMFFSGLLLFTLANRSVNETVRTIYAALTSPRNAENQAAQFWLIGLTTLTLAVLAAITFVKRAMDVELAQGVSEPFVWLEGVSTWPNLAIRFVGLLTVLGLWCLFGLKMHHQKTRIAKDFEIPLTTVQTLDRSWWSAIWTGPHLDLASFEKDGTVTTLWHNYLRATSFREMKWWIGASILITYVFIIAMFSIWDRPSFPHRGLLAQELHTYLLWLHTIVFWLIIFWIGYETRACVQFVNTLSGVRNEWPEELLFRKAKETGIPPAHLDHYLDFQLIVGATQRIQSLIYLPFISIFFLVIARSNFFSAMDFPLPIVLIIGFALTYLLYSARLLRKSAEKMHNTVLKNYENLQSTPTWPPVHTEQIDRLMNRIRNTHTGVFAPFAQQPALQALLLPFGGYGSVQIIEYLFKL